MSPKRSVTTLGLFMLMATLWVGSASAMHQQAPSQTTQMKHATYASNSSSVDNEQPAALRKLNRKTTNIMDGLVAMEDKALRKAFEIAKRKDGVADVQQLFQVLQEGHGKVEGYKVLGTVPFSSRRAQTLVQVSFAEGSEVLRLVWHGQQLATIQRAARPTTGNTKAPATAVN